MLVAGRAELGTGFAVRKIVPFWFENGVPKPPTLQGVGPVGHSQGMGWENIEGTFFARDGKGSHSEHGGIGVRANFVFALEAWPRLRFVSLHVLWRDGPVSAL